MRIRKRKVPLPLSLLSPVPLSDPHLFSRSPVMLVQDVAAATTTTTNSVLDNFSQLPVPAFSPSDHFTTTPTYPETTSTSDLRRGMIVESTTTVDVVGCEAVVGGVQTSNDYTSSASLTTTGVATVAQEKNDNGPRFLSLSNNEGDQVGRWCDDDKAVPLKKRKGIEFNSFVDDDKEKDMITPTATAMIMMKWKSNTDDDEEEEEKQRGSVVVVAADGDTSKKDKGGNNNNGVVVGGVASSGKKGSSKRGNTILEGSRCSRVNGRGWRCCQPTLVGYSLCEHHLGKGRLRSMTNSCSAKSQSSSAKRKTNNNTTTTTPTTAKSALGRDDERQAMEDYDDGDKKLERMSSFGNKRVKLGVVKARSLSILLGQTNTLNIAADHATAQQDEKATNLDRQD